MYDFIKNKIYIFLFHFKFVLVNDCWPCTLSIVTPLINKLALLLISQFVLPEITKSQSMGTGIMYNKSTIFIDKAEYDCVLNLFWYYFIDKLFLIKYIYIFIVLIDHKL